MKELLEAGVHFGHQTKRWNPKMKKYIFGKRNGIYIIDLQKTLKLFKEASSLASAKRVGAKVGRGGGAMFAHTPLRPNSPPQNKQATLTYCGSSQMRKQRG